MFSYQLNKRYVTALQNKININILLCIISLLGPDIASSSIQCETSLCNSSNYKLQASSVTITFEHSESIKVWQPLTTLPV